ncbi:MAG TPA: CoA transferase [Acidimicrobiales bacterium]|nr:CoA transferase [Acidimicrobiales bacterium]
MAAVGTSPEEGPLGGIRVLDACGPEGELCGRTLAELGAEVLKVEPPGGVASRRRGPRDQVSGDSLYWAAVGAGKVSVVLDLEEPSDRSAFFSLGAEADVLVESWPPTGPLRGEIDRWRESQPGLVHVSITPYGSSGPKAGWPGTELTSEAASGRLVNQGDRDRPPIPIGHPQAYYHAGVQAAADAVAALYRRERTGLGQHLDVSIQAVMVHTLFGTVSGTMLDSDGAQPPEPPSPEAAAKRTAAADRRAARLALLPEVWECADGLVAAPLAAGGLPLAAHIAGLLAEEGSLDAEVAAIDWNRLAADVLRERCDDAVVRRALDALAGWFRRHTKAELYRLAHEGDFRMAPLMTTADLLADSHLTERGFWTQLGGRTHPGAAVGPLLVRPPGPAPGLPDRRGLRPWARPRVAPPCVPSGDGPGPDAFSGLRVADFSWVAVGPTIGRALADHGATVVRVESSRRLDVARTLAPFKGDGRGPDDSHWYAHFNASKLGLTLNLRTDAAREVARRLVGWADVVLESFSPGTMAGLGLDYATLSAERPDLVMLSASLLGQTGPMADFAGFGQQGVGLCGISTITGWPDRPPVPPLGAYTDVVAPKYGLAALGAALIRRQRTGEGAHLDLGQVEASIRFIEPLILDQTVNGRTARRWGLDSINAAPHGVYPVVGRHRFLALAVETPEQWRALVGLAGLDAYTGAAYDQMALRRREAAGIDAALADWTRLRDGRDAERLLCQAGVPSALVAQPREVAADPQLWHRGLFVAMDHTVMGLSPYESQPTLFSTGGCRVRRAAPALGQDTGYVLSELLGYQEDQINELAAVGALD